MILFHTFAGIEAYPICLATQDVDEIVAAVQHITPAFGGINLEDISAPRCFEMEERLRNMLDIPVVHDDQHGTAIVILAGIMNALRLVQKQNVTAVLVGAGAAGIATAKLLLEWDMGTLVLVDRIGILRPGLAGMTPIQEELAACTNPEGRSGGLAEAVVGADIFIGVSAPGILSPDMVRSMAPHAIVFALANPDPEIPPDAAKESWSRSLRWTKHQGRRCSYERRMDAHCGGQGRCKSGGRANNNIEREKKGIRPLSRRKKCMPPTEKKNKLIGRQLLRSRVDSYATKRSFDTA